jgi:hypothetical protein
LLDINEINQRLIRYEVLSSRGYVFTSRQEKDISNIRSQLKSETSEEAVALDDRLKMVMDISSRNKEKRHAQ